MTAFLTPGIESLNLRINVPLEADGVTVRDDLSNVKVWYSTVSSTFNPDIGEGTLAYNGLGLAITIPGLTPGVTYYIKYALISEIDPAVYVISSALTAIPDSTVGSLDATPAPTPTGLVVSPGISNIVITHDAPTYTQGSGHGKTYLYGIKYTTGAIPTFNSAGVTCISQFTGNISSYATEPSTTWYLWVKWETKDGVQSLVPASAVTTTGQDVSLLLTALNAKITSSQLNSALSTRINLIDNASTGLVTTVSNLQTTYGTTASAATSAIDAAQYAVTASQSASQAIQAKADALIAKTSADSSATSANISSNAAIQAEANAVIAKIAAETAKTDADIYATAANTSVISANTKAAEAAVSANSAAASASSATGSAASATSDASTAANSANSAGNSAAAAVISASSATTQATAASLSAAAADSSATTATTKASQAAVSATSAAAAVDTATSSAAAASSSAATAVSSSNSAGDSAAAAVVSATTATTQATAAGLSANSADTSATTATTKAGQAAVSATSAATSADTATGSAAAASNSESTAANSANNAGNSAAAAIISASSATTQATAASLSAAAADSSATTATTKASQAAVSATSAASAADTATSSAAAASSSAATAVSSSNSAGDSAAAAVVSATTATTQATAAGLSANSADTSATTATTKAAQAAVSATSAATSADTATGSASSASSSATTAANSSNSAGLSAAAASTSAITATTKADEAGNSAISASNSAIAASSSSGSAGVYASNSATSATNAAGSATSAATALTNVQATVRGTSLGLPLSQWTLNGQSMVTVSDGKVGTSALRLSGPGGYPNQGNYIPIDPTKKYRARFWARPVSTTTGLLYFSLQQFIDDAGTTGPVNGGRSPYKPSGQSRAAHNATYGTDAWGEYSYVWDAADWQAGVKYFRPDFLDNYSDEAGYWDVQDFTLNEVTGLEANYAAIQTLATTTAGPNGTTAQYSVKLDTNGYVSGFGLTSTSNTATPQSEFIFKADRFAFGAPGLTTAYPFVIQATDVVVNSVVTVPKGVYMDAAYIKNGTITNAKIGDATIDTAKIANLNAAKITAGFLNVDRIEGGSIIADKINATGLVIKDTSGFPIMNVGSALDFNSRFPNTTNLPVNNATRNKVTHSSYSSFPISAAIGDIWVQTTAIGGVKNLILESQYSLTNAVNELLKIIVGVSPGNIDLANRLNTVVNGRLVGDIDGSGNINTADTTALQNYIVGTLTNTTQLAYINDVFIPIAINVWKEVFDLPGLGSTSYRISATGSSATSNGGLAPGFYQNGSTTATIGAARSYIVVKILRTTGVATQVNSYDVYGSAANATTMATDLNAIDSSYIVVVYTHDEPLANRLTNGLAAAMYRHGASKAVFGSNNFKYRSAYILIGIGGCGEGNGAELYQGATDSDVNAWVDAGFTITKGALTGVSSSATPKSLTDYGYIGELDATKGANADNFTGKVGGGNLLDVGSLAHTSTDSYPAGWKVAYSSITPTITRYTTGGAIANGAYLKIDAFYPSGGLFAIQCGSATNGQTGGVRGGFIAGRTYTISFYMRYNGPIGLSVSVGAPGAGMSSISLVSGTVDYSSAWYRLVYRGTCTTADATGSFSLSFNHTGYTGTIQMSNVQVEEGDVPTAFTDTLNLTTANALAGAGHIKVGSLVLNTDGTRASGSGVAIGPKGIGAYNSTGAATFAIDGTTGVATFAGSVNVGAYTSYAWPASGSTGAHLSASGLRIGNANSTPAAYFEATAAGNISTPGFTIIDGTMTLNAVNVVKTSNILANAATICISATSASGTSSCSVILAQISDVFIIGQAALPSSANIGIYYKLSTSGTWLAAGQGAEYIQGLGCVTGKLQLAAGTWDFSVQTGGARSSVVVFVSIR